MNFIVIPTLSAIKQLYNETVAESVINIQETRKEFEGLGVARIHQSRSSQTH